MIRLLFFICFSIKVLTEEISSDLFDGIFLNDETLVEKALLSSFTNPNAQMSSDIKQKQGLDKDFPSLSALHVAVGHKLNFPIIDRLLDAGADINFFTQDFPPPVLYSILCGYNSEKSIVNLLDHLTQRIDFSTDISLDNSTAHWNEVMGFHQNFPFMHYLLMNKLFAVANKLINIGAIDPCKPDAFGISSLHLVTWLGYDEVIPLLLNQKCNLSAIDTFNRTIFHYAIIRGQQTILSQLLLEGRILHNNPNIDFDLVSILLGKDKFGYSVLDIIQLPPSNYNISSMVLSTLKLLKVDKKILYERNNGWDIHSRCNRLSSYIDTRHYTEINDEVFNKEYRSLQRPVVITGNMTGDSIHLWKYLKKELFVERYKDIKLSTVSNINEKQCYLL